MEDNQTLDSSAYPCDECGKIFPKSQYLASHKAYTHHIEVSVCEFCSNEFKNKEKLRHHINSVHRDANYICDMCSKAFKNHSLLYGHKKIVHEVAEVMCSNCGIIMVNAYKLKKHLKRCLNKKQEEVKDDKVGEDDFTCYECNSTFASRKSFKQHNKSVHTYNPATCQFCRKDFKNITCFRQHLLRAHEITDPDRILALIKDARPDYKEVNRKKKRNNSPNMESEQKSSNISEYQKQRNDLLNKWKEIEKEKNEKAALLKVELNDSFNDDYKIPKEETILKGEDIKMNKDLMNDIKMNKDLLDAFDINFYEKEQCERNYDGKETLKSTDEPDGMHFLADKSSQDNDSDNILNVVKIEANDEIENSTISKDNISEKWEGLGERKEDDSNEGVLNLKTEPNDSQETENKQILNEWKVNEPAVNECSECGKLFSQVKYLIGHIKTAHTYEPCDCPYCDGKTFKNRLYLSQHLKRMHQNFNLPKEKKEKKPKRTTKVNNGPFICDLCGKQFESSGKLRSHKKTHNDEKQQCPYCPSICKNLNSHIINSHNKVECVCNQCGKTCMSKVALRGHIATVHPSEGQRRICSLCGKEFKNTASLRQHQRKTFGCSQTDPASIVNCPECGKEFINKHALYNHRYHTHMFEDVNCPNCGKTFKSKLALSKHIKRTCSTPVNSKTDLMCY